MNLSGYFDYEELGNEVDIVKFDSNLATIINILSKEDLNKIDQDIKVNVFEIERKIQYNQLNVTRMIINDYSEHYYTRLDKKYQEFDKQGSNKSYSVLQSIKKSYIEECKKSKDNDSDSIFLQVIENVKNKIIQSANYVKIPVDELELCIDILVVDAFIHCKVFEDPEGYNYVTT